MTTPEEDNLAHFEETDRLVTVLENELAHARANWSIYIAGNGLDPTTRSELHNLLNMTYEAHTFSHIIQSAASMTVLSLCRLTDKWEPDRISLRRLKKLLEPKYIEIFAANGAGWFKSHA